MKKYLGFTKLALKEDFFYRANFFFYFIRQFLWFLVNILFWLAVYENKSEINGYSLSNMIIYMLIIYLVNIMTVTGVHHFLGEAIKSGELSFHLMRPVSVLKAIFFQQLGRRIYRLIYIFILLIILILLKKIHVNLVNLFIFPIILFNATLLSFLYHFLLGIIAFWLKQATSVLFLLSKPLEFLGGAWFPLNFFSNKIAGFLYSLPFYLILGFPADFFQNKLSLKLSLVYTMQQYGWILLLLWLVSIFWQKGVKQYEAVGL